MMGDGQGPLRYSIIHRKERVVSGEVEGQDTGQGHTSQGKLIDCLVLTVRELLWFCLSLVLVRF